MMLNQPKLARTNFVRLFFALALLLSLMLSAFMAQSVKAQARTGVLVIETPTISLGGTVTFSAAGFDPGEKIAIWVTTPGGTAISSGYVNADNTGVVTSFTPAYKVVTSPGTWALTVRGLNSGLQGFVNFTVRTPTLTVAAVNVGNDAVLFFMSGRYWYPGEKINFWVTDGQGSVAVNFPSSAGHSVSYIWAKNDGSIPKSPDDNNILGFRGTPGTYKVTAQGNTSGVQLISDLNANPLGR